MELTHPYTLSYIWRRGRHFGHVILVDSINIFKEPHRLWFWKRLYKTDNHSVELTLTASPEVIQWSLKQGIQYELSTRRDQFSSDQVIFSFTKREHAMRFKMRFG